jgi:hypothetical protein
MKYIGSGTAAPGSWIWMPMLNGVVPLGVSNSHPHCAELRVVHPLLPKSATAWPQTICGESINRPTAEILVKAP